ncbi:MAG: NUDIX hydrolase [Dehalococcoidia bacterium]
MTHLDMMHGTGDYNYCPNCGSKATYSDQTGQRILSCECGYIHYKDPKVAAGVLIKDPNNRILLMKRAHHPRKGYWSYPSGYVDYGEKVETAAKREVMEEVGVEVSIDELIGVYSEEGNRVILVLYQGTITKGSPSPGEESEEVAYYSLNELPEMAFPRDVGIIGKWMDEN